MAQLMFGSLLRSVLLNTGSVSLLTKEGGYGGTKMSMKKAGYSVVIPNINYSNFIHFSKNKLRHEIRLWCFQNLGEWVMCGTGLACHKLIDFFFLFIVYYGMETLGHTITA